MATAKKSAAEAVGEVIDAPERAQARLVELPIAELKPWPELNPRSDFDETKLQELATSFRAMGIHSPIGVHRPDGDDFSTGLIVFGERRWRAAQIAGLEVVPCLVREYTWEEAVDAAVIENLQREELSSVDEARGFQMWLQVNPRRHIQDLADRIGKSQPYVSNRLRLLELPEEVQDLISAGVIPFGPARDLLVPLAKLPDAQPEIAFKRVLAAIDAMRSQGSAIEGPHLQVIVGRVQDDLRREFETRGLFDEEPAPATSAEETPPAPAEAEDPPSAPPARPAPPAPEAKAAPPAAPKAPVPAPAPAPAAAAPAEPVAILPPPGTPRDQVPEGAGLVTAVLAITGRRPTTISINPLPNGDVAVMVAPRPSKAGESPFAKMGKAEELDAALLAAIDAHFNN